jgi:ATP adenylyltransferase
VNEQLWAPWRIGYITGADDSKTPEAVSADLRWAPGADKDCFICRAVADHAPGADKQNLVVARTSLAIAVLNRYPYNNGHLLVAPRQHVAKIQDLASKDHLALMELISQACTIFERAMNAEGFNVGLNLGRTAGAGVPGHLHWHVLPRWGGDTNFMPVLSGTNVISQALEAAWDLLQREFAHTSQ